MPRAGSAKLPCLPVPPRGLCAPRCFRRPSIGRSPTSRQRPKAPLSQRAGTSLPPAQRRTGRKTTISFKLPIAQDAVVMCWESSWRSDFENILMPPLVAYFSMEYGLHEEFHSYAGGLGILAGDFM